MRGLKSKKAFTLAEVLITLGIIGVVAALTLPTLIANYQKTQTLTSLKKNYTILAQGIEFAQANYGTDLQGWTCADCPFPQYYNNQFSINVPNLFNVLSESIAFAKVVNIGNIGQYSGIGFCDLPEGQKYKTMGGSDLSIGAGGYWSSGWAQLKDGSCWFIGGTKNSNTSDEMVRVTVDTNGNKNPNKMGRDVFVFVIHRNGQITGVSGNSCNGHWSNGGEACAQRIIEAGWQIKPDYPWK
ncbi:type II secretion system protein [bacterium]|nr:type II secretion system protein [bacterium]